MPDCKIEGGGFDSYSGKRLYLSYFLFFSLMLYLAHSRVDIETWYSIDTHKRHFVPIKHDRCPLSAEFSRDC